MAGAVIRLICQWDVDTKVTERVTIEAVTTQGVVGLQEKGFDSSKLRSLKGGPAELGLRSWGLAGWVVLPDVLLFLGAQ